MLPKKRRQYTGRYDFNEEDEPFFNDGDRVCVFDKNGKQLFIGTIIKYTEGKYRVSHLASWGGMTSGWYYEHRLRKLENYSKD